MSNFTYDPVLIARHRFAFGHYRQEWWSWLIGSAFFFGEIGAGLFLFALIIDYWPGMLVGYLIVNVGKNGAHLMYLGRPERFWRAAMRPDRSWIARGIWATGIFMGCGFVVLFPQFAAPWWVPGEQLLTAAAVVAGASALFIMFYDGFVMNASPAIPFWHSHLLPLLCLSYAALGGSTLTITMLRMDGIPVPEALLVVEYFFLFFNLLLLGFYLFHTSRMHPTARESVRLLLRGAYAFTFLGLVLIVGLFGAFTFSMIHKLTDWNAIITVIALCELTGSFALLMVLLKSGLLAPQSAYPVEYRSGW
jgi:formate-dependent nitrite reductase membrane component NrfD